MLVDSMLVQHVDPAMLPGFAASASSLAVMVQRLDQLQCRAWLNLLIQPRIFAGGQIGFEARVGLGKRRADRGGQFCRAIGAWRSPQRRKA